MFYDRSKPFEKVIPYYDRFDPGIQVEIPQAYIIPQGWHKVLERLSANKIEMLPISSDTIFKVEAYRISNVEYSRSPYEGHFLHRNIEISKESKSVSFRQGDFYIPSEQPGVRYLLETLEPEATDSYFHWNFFDAIMQQKEYFSSYVFEDIALQLLKDDPEMNSRFEAEKAANTEFAQSRRAQLDWIYRNSPYYEPAHLSYPVYRLVK